MFVFYFFSFVSNTFVYLLLNQILALLVFVIRTTDTSVGVGQTATFECKTRGGKDPKTRWVHRHIYYQKKRKNGVTDPSARIYVTPDDKFVMSQVVADDQNSVTCVIEDTDLDKTIEFKVMLTVLSKLLNLFPDHPTFLYQIPSEISLDENKNLLVDENSLSSC